MIAKALRKLLLPSGGTDTDISSAEVSLRTGPPTREVISSVSGMTWFGPNQPMRPLAPEGVLPRTFDYPYAFNVNPQPRTEEGVGPTFGQLRALAYNFDLLRLVIETRKDQFEKLPWTLQLTEEEGEKKQDHIKRTKSDRRISELTALFRIPDGEHLFPVWLRMVLEEIFVTDGLCIWPVRDKSKTIRSLRLIDAATVKPLIDPLGWRPIPPDPAYQQIIKGMPAQDLTTDQLYYGIRNARVHSIYGFSPVEQIILTVNLALRRQMSQLAYYTSGNVPEMIIQAPQNWTDRQIADFQAFFDTLMGDQDARRRVRFIPETKGITQTKEAMLKDEMDEWLARVVCFAFSIPPTPFVKQMNRATAQQLSEAASSEGLLPLMNYTAATFSHLIGRYFGYSDIEFKWNTDQEADQLRQAQIDKIYVDMGKIGVDELRERDGQEPLGIPVYVMTGSGPIPVSQIGQPPPQAAGTETIPGFDETESEGDDAEPSEEETIPAEDETDADKLEAWAEGELAKCLAKAGTSEGAMRSWDTRGRKGHQATAGSSKPLSIDRPAEYHTWSAGKKAAWARAAAKHRVRMKQEHLFTVHPRISHTTKPLSAAPINPGPTQPIPIQFHRSAVMAWTNSFFEKAGTSEGAARAWDTRGRGKEEKPGSGSKKAGVDVKGSSKQDVFTLKAVQERAWSGTPTATKTVLSKQQAGALGEKLVMSYLHHQGKSDARPMNAKVNNYAVDMLQNHGAIEIKTGLVSNGKTAMHWRATIGQPGKQETAWLKTASKEEKREWNKGKAAAILDRKNAALKAISKQLGKPVKGRTITTIINPDKKTVDVYEFKGFHLYIRWTSPEARKGYVGTFSYK